MFALILRTCALSRNDASVRRRCCATDVRNMCYEGYVHITCMSDADEVFLWQHARFEFRGCHSLALSPALVTRRRGRANAKVSPDDNYTCHKASHGAVATRETIAGAVAFRSSNAARNFP